MNAFVLLIGLCGAVELPHRVPNGPIHGQCYWACVDSILKTNTSETSISTGIGLDGAADEDIKTMFIAFDITKIEALTPQGAIKSTRAGKHVIAIMRPWRTNEECHAIILLDAQTFYTDRRHSYIKITYYDPNFPTENRTMYWSEFVAKFRRGHILEKK